MHRKRHQARLGPRRENAQDAKARPVPLRRRRSGFSRADGHGFLCLRQGSGGLVRCRESVLDHATRASCGPRPTGSRSLLAVGGELASKRRPRLRSIDEWAHGDTEATRRGDRLLQEALRRVPSHLRRPLSRSSPFEVGRRLRERVGSRLRGLPAHLAEGSESLAYLVVKAGEPVVKTATVPSVVWMQLAESSRESEPDLKDLLLALDPKTGELPLPRRRFRYRDAPRCGS